jgi:hypothetical protein
MDIPGGLLLYRVTFFNLPGRSGNSQHILVRIIRLSGPALEIDILLESWLRSWLIFLRSLLAPASCRMLPSGLNRFRVPVRLAFEHEVTTV